MQVPGSLTWHAQRATLQWMNVPFKSLLLIALAVSTVGSQTAGGAEAQPVVAANVSQAAVANDPIVGSYDCVRYGTTFSFQPDGTVTGADGLGDGTWQAANPAQHIYIVKIRPSKMDSPERYESWTVTLESAGLTQDRDRRSSSAGRSNCSAVSESYHCFAMPSSCLAVF